MQRIDEMSEPPVLGRFYLVPIVRYPYWGREDDWPVIGPKHSDVEFFNFPMLHYHIDGRFLNSAQRAHIDSPDRGWEFTVAASPLSTRGGKDYESTPHPDPVWSRRKCSAVRVWHPGAPEGAPAFRNLRRAYAGKVARRSDGRLVCPHRGADLSSIAPDEHGIVTCPLHGLLVSCGTGRVLTLRQIRAGLAQAGEARSGETREAGLDPKDDHAVPEGHAPNA